ncbi:MAG: tetratricopeptide repeat protein [Methanomicrobiales archaeon]
MKTNKALEYKNQGNNYFKEGDYENALQYYGKALEIDPDYRDAWNNIYLTLLKLDRTDDAKKCKEMLDKLEDRQDSAPMKGVADRPYKHIRLALAVIIVILLAMSIILAALSILGWISYREVIPIAPEQQFSDIMNTTISGFIKIVSPS